MSEISKFSNFKKFLEKGPIILLIISVLNEFDFNYLNLKYFSFNFPFILIYYWSLKRSGSLGYGLIFLCGLLNDVVTGLPIGVSSLAYLLICMFCLCICVCYVFNLVNGLLLCFCASSFACLAWHA